MLLFVFFMILPLPRSTLFPYTTLFRSDNRYQRQPVADVHGSEKVTLFTFELEIADRAALEHFWETAEDRSEEHTSELQSRRDLVCRLLLEKKKKGNREIQGRHSHRTQ